MKPRPNVLWLMSDQHNANCTGYRGHPNVKTPNLDRIAASGIDFTHAYANNPICAPSRTCFMTGEYMHTHRFFGNYDFAYPEAKHEHLGYVFRMHGYQTALIGKSHMVSRWDRDGFEHLRYCDLMDSDRRDPMTNHYFRYLSERGLADRYEEGTPKPGQEYTMDGSGPALRSRRQRNTSTCTTPTRSSFPTAPSTGWRTSSPASPRSCGIDSFAGVATPWRTRIRRD